jgi:hypothetical protein
MENSSYSIRASILEEDHLEERGELGRTSEK